MEPQLVVGDIRGYRAWFVDVNNVLCPLTSAAQGARIAVDRAKEIHSATCYKSVLHKAPAESCTCGFYAVYGGAAALGQLLTRHLVMPSLGLVIGAVRMSGMVLLGENGVMRAEKMQIEAYLKWSIRKTTQHLEESADRHQLPLVPIAEFLVNYPLAQYPLACSADDAGYTMEELLTYHQLLLQQFEKKYDSFRSFEIGTLIAPNTYIGAMP